MNDEDKAAVVAKLRECHRTLIDLASKTHGTALYGIVHDAETTLIRAVKMLGGYPDAGSKRDGDHV